ncbi:MAG: nucleoside hydrolase [Pseudomonadota bacterium]|nr:nucleoside hydrolase [Pseudomonadota bacterium]
MRPTVFVFLMGVFSTATAAAGAQNRLVLIDQDGSGPGGSNQMAMMILLQSPQVEVLGITMVTGNAWRDDEARHTLRMLELIGRTDVPVALGAVFPLVRTQEETRLNTSLMGQVAWLGAWGQRPTVLTDTGAAAGKSPPSIAGPWDAPPLEEGEPHTQPIAEDAAHFLIRQVHAHPHQVTLYAAGPLTNIALAVALDPHFAELTQGLVVMGGSLNPQTDDPEFATSPRHEFNFWFDPEAARMTLRAHWPRVDVTTVDVSIKAMFSQKMLDDISASANPAARYIAKYSRERYYLWDELAACAWLDPSIITKRRDLFMDVDVSHGPTYGETLTWSEALKPAIDVRLVHAQIDLDLPKFSAMFVELMSARTPQGNKTAARKGARSAAVGSF